MLEKNQNANGKLSNLIPLLSFILYARSLLAFWYWCGYLIESPKTDLYVQLKHFFSLLCVRYFLQFFSPDRLSL